MSSNGPPWGKANHFSVYERLFPFQSTWKVMIFIKQKQQLCTCITLLGAFLWCPEHEIPNARTRSFQFSVTQGTEIKLNLVFVRTGRSASVQLWNIISPKTLVLGLAPGGGGGGYSLQWPIRRGSTRKGYLFQASGIRKVMDFTRWRIRKGRKICHLGL